MKTLSDFLHQFKTDPAAVTYADTDQFYALIMKGCDYLPPEVDHVLADVDAKTINAGLTGDAGRSAILAAFLTALRHGVNTCPPVAITSITSIINAAAVSDKHDHYIALLSRLCGALNGVTFADHVDRLDLRADIKSEPDPDNRRAIYTGAVYNWLQYNLTI